MNNKTESFKEKLRQALSSTARVISDDLGINPKKNIRDAKKQDLIELENLNSKNDFIKARAETDSKALKKKFITFVFVYICCNCNFFTFKNFIINEIFKIF